ncbi:hypothetical protein V501_01895 [Pseudogymnoascus sp. VKM F-4519 (FW-2642)]|nr:hypothetical protein V500_03156 [Pseudogymnoascus sp. VKM F-4518 (FW-2643)]KFZ17104.1 hypothetical protein V501_01895 [Pseudogymnoascus sp. VKM F-4519 (FW-2642)]
MAGLTTTQNPQFDLRGLLGCPPELLGSTSISEDSGLANACTISHGWLIEGGEQEGQMYSDRRAPSSCFTDHTVSCDYMTVPTNFEGYSSFQFQSRQSTATLSTPELVVDSPTSQRGSLSTDSATVSRSPDMTSLPNKMKPRRQAQNRESQRAYRDRKTKVHEDLVQQYAELEQKYNALSDSQGLSHAKLAELKKVLTLVLNQL